LMCTRISWIGKKYMILDSVGLLLLFDSESSAAGESEYFLSDELLNIDLIYPAL